MKEQRKRILLINRYFHIGGIQSSLINMANELSKSYDVDILAFYASGELKDRLNPCVNVICSSWAFRVLTISPKELLATKNIFMIVYRMFFAFWTRLFDNRLPVYVATKFQKKLTGYDLAIAYRAEPRKKLLSAGFARVLDRCIQAKKKAVWIHHDAYKVRTNAEFNTKYYANIDKVVGVSKSVMKAFAEEYPLLKDKMDFCYNFMDYDALFKKSNDQQNICYPENKFICFSACRLGEEKGIVRALNAFASTFDKYKDIMWFIAGDGPEKEKIKIIIEQKNLQDRIVLLGNQSNPYPYMKNADLYISVSYHEAAPVVYMEAKALGVPVFTTRTVSSDEMLDDGVNAFICDNSEEGIREKFASLMSNRANIYSAKEFLKDCKFDNTLSIKKIEEFIG